MVDSSRELSDATPDEPSRRRGDRDRSAAAWRDASFPRGSTGSSTAPRASRSRATALT